MQLEATARADERGTSLIEALIALTILAVSLVYVFGTLSSFSVINGRNATRSNAAAAARTRLEQLRFIDPETLPASGSQTGAATVGPHEFTVITQYCVDSAYCDDRTRHVVVRIQEDGQNVFETETVITQLR